MGIGINNLTMAVMDELHNYSQEVTDELKEVVKEVAKECKDDVKTNSPKNEGGYKKGWQVKTEFENEQAVRCRIVNKKKPQLTHLLEYGHAKVSGGRVDGRAHIEPAEKRAIINLEKRIKERLG